MCVYLFLSCVRWVETVFKCVNIVYLFTQKHAAFAFLVVFMYAVRCVCSVRFQQRKTCKIFSLIIFPVNIVQLQNNDNP